MKSEKLPLTIVVAMDNQRGIGLNNALPWNIKEDLAHFKKTTYGRPVIMGRKTFESIGRILLGRLNVIVTRNSNLQIDGVEVRTSLLDACLAATSDGEAFIIGGSEIFELAMPMVQRLVITEIHAAFECDAFFPAIDKNDWIEEGRQRHQSSAGVDYSIVNYTRSRVS